jgi:hypothetical protein
MTMQYAACGKCSHPLENHTLKEENGVTIEITSCKEKDCKCLGYGRVPHCIITLEGLKKSYNVTEHIEFSLRLRGCATTSTRPPIISLRRVYKESDLILDPLLRSTPIEDLIWAQTLKPLVNSNSLKDNDVTIKIPSNYDQPIQARERGIHSLVVTSEPNEFRKTFEVK